MSENNATMSAGMPASAPAFGSDVKRLPLKDLLKRIGPGLIATGIVIGPGAVTTASMIGANYGYDLMWLFFPIIFMGITFMMVTNRLAIVTGMPTIHAIRKYYGPVASGIVGCAMFLSCLFFTMGNISGTGAGMNLIFGLDWKIGSAIMIAVVVYMYFAKNVYSKVEKIITLCIVLMIVAFYATLVGVGGPEPQGLAKGLFGFKVPEGSLSTALAFISTNAAVTAGIYGTYLGKEKKWKKDDLFNGVMLTDAITHIVSVSLISGAIVLVGAVVLHPQGLSIKAPAQLQRCWCPSWAAVPATSWVWPCWAQASLPCWPIPSAAWCCWVPVLTRTSAWRASSSALAAWSAWPLPWWSVTATAVLLRSSF